MTREEAIALFEKQLTAAQVVLDSGFGSNTGENDFLYRRRKEMAEIALSALRPVSREQVEKVWRGEWIGMTDDDGCTWLECSRCEYGLDSLEEPNHFCPACGSPMDDEAVDILYNNLKKLFEQEDS